MDDVTPTERLRPELDGVPETTLWTLYHRAREAGRRGSPLHDPKARQLLAALDFDFRGRFGSGPPAFGRFIGFRAMTFDRVVLSVLATDPDAVVAVLGEGLETQFWRVDNGRVRWFTVELPETAAVRESLLPADPPRRRLFAGSATDHAWMDELGAQPGDRVVVVAQGLLMYLPPAEVRRLITTCAERFPGGVMAFDTVPRWFSKLSVAGKLKDPSGYEAPPMPWGADPAALVRRLPTLPHIADASLVQPPGLGLVLGGLVRLGRGLPGLDKLWPGVVRVDFARQ